MNECCRSRWVRDFSRADLGDARRSARLPKLLRQMDLSRGETIAGTFFVPAQRQAAYDFIENKSIDATRLSDAIAGVAARKARDQKEILVIVDGTSLTLTDKARAKGFGSIGPKIYPTRGIKIMSSLFVATNGVPIGVGPLISWTRDDEVIDASKYRPACERESHYWHVAVDRAAEIVEKHAPRTRCHFVCDREADAGLLLKKLAFSGHEFTIRGSQRRKVLIDDKRLSLHEHVRKAKPITTLKVLVPESHKRKAREAVVEVFTASVDLVVRDREIHRRSTIPLSVVWAREVGGPRDSKLNWLLYTSKPATTAEQAKAVITTYTRRWRIEDFHRSWKRGGCHVECNQLRSVNAAMKWATLTAVIAARSERLKHLARTTPDEPATIEFTVDELDVLRIMKTKQKKRTEVLVEGTPTIAIATLWVAEIGGYVGAKSSGPPGATVIARGLGRLEIGAEVIAAYKASLQKR
jgi:hypothetical protein